MIVVNLSAHPNGKTIKKAFRILLRIAAILILLIGILAGLCLLPSVQTFLAHRLSAYLSSELKTTVSIDKVHLIPFKTANINGLLIKDLHNDTLLYAGELNVNVNEIQASLHKLELDKVLLKDASFFLRRYKGEEHDNLHFISEYFASNDTTSSTPWSLLFDQVELKNVHFIRDNKNEIQIPHGVDFEHLDISKINGNFSDVIVIGDTIFADIKGLTFKDHSGFEVKSFSADSKVSPVGITCNNLRIETPQTNLQTDLTFSFNEFADFDDFENKILFTSLFRNSKISFDDISYFAHDLYGLKNQVLLTGNFTGKVNRFKGKNIFLQFGLSSYFKGNVSMAGLPNFEETYIDVLAEEILANASDIEKIPLPPFDSVQFITVPDEVKRLGNVSFKGKFNGFVNDFVAYGNFKTDIGFISSDLNMKLNEVTQFSEYSGKITANNFNAGALLAYSDLGKVTFSADVNGKGFLLKKMFLDIQGDFDEIEFKKYAYRNVRVNGTLDAANFIGSLGIHESNVDFDFNGAIDLSSKIPKFNLTADIGKLVLDTLNLIELKGSGNEVSAQVNMEFSGNNIDNITGFIQLNNINFKSDIKLYHVNNIALKAFKDNAFRIFDLESDNINANFRGQFDFKTLGTAFKNTLPRFLPSLADNTVKKQIDIRQNFTYSILFKNTDLITEVFLPSWRIEPGLKIAGNYNTIGQNYELKLTAPSLYYKNFGLQDASMILNADATTINNVLTAKKFYYADSLFLEYPVVKTKIFSDTIFTDAKIPESDTFPNRGNLLVTTIFKKDKSIFSKLDKADIKINGETWVLDSTNYVSVDSAGIELNNINFYHNNESLLADGRIGSTVNDALKVDFKNFDLKNINPLLKADGVELGGLLTGESTIKNISNKAQLQSDLSVLSLQLNGDTLGNAAFKSTFNSDDEILYLDGKILKNNFSIADIKGKYEIGKKKNNIDFDVLIDRFNLATVARYVDDIIGNLKGKFKAEVKVTGTFAEPEIKGVAHLTKTSFLVRYLNTEYNLTSDVLIGKNYFELKDFQIEDFKGGKEKTSSAIANGFIYHNNFKDFNFDVRLAANKFLGLNTNAAQNSLYYGRAIVSGNASFEGPLENMNISLALQSEKGTSISIPISSQIDVSQNNFIRFVNRSNPQQDVKEEKENNPSGVSLDMAFTVTPDAELKIIFDEKIGDVITGYGRGNLQMNMSNAGDFNIYGAIDIERGDYLFTLQNVINRHLIIRQPSYISWSGDPFNAIVDITAVYRVNTSTLYNLIEDSTYKRKLPVDCIITLEDKLFNPTIKYQIDVKDIDASAQSLVKARLNTESEINNQMFGLLVLGQFLPSGQNQNGQGVSAGNSVGNNASQLLSSQVSNWLNQLNTGVNLGFNYKPKDDYSEQEFTVQFSKDLTERISIEGNVRYGNNTYTSDLAGDFSAEYKIRPDGKLRVKAYNRANNNLRYYNAPYTQGVGIFYRQEFDNLRELFEKKTKKAAPVSQ